MSFSEAWDRMFWSVMLIIFVGVLWLKFLEDTAACAGPGLVVAIAIGLTFFGTGWYQAQQRQKREEAEAKLAGDSLQVPEELV